MHIQEFLLGKLMIVAIGGGPPTETLKISKCSEIGTE